MDDLQFYILFNSISVISGQWKGDSKRMCATEDVCNLESYQGSLYLIYEALAT